MGTSAVVETTAVIETTQRKETENCILVAIRVDQKLQDSPLRLVAKNVGFRLLMRTTISVKTCKPSRQYLMSYVLPWIVKW
jgi:hypothetical protein